MRHLTSVSCFEILLNSLLLRITHLFLLKGMQYSVAGVDSVRLEGRTLEGTKYTINEYFVHRGSVLRSDGRYCQL